MSVAVRMWPLDAPTMVVPRSALAAGPVDHRPVRIPVSAYLIEHQDGLLLFDTSLTPEAATDPRAAYGERAERLQLRFTRNQAVDHQVTAAGCRLDDVTSVVLSHLHFDHAGGAYLFSGAQLLLGAGELAHARTGTDGYCRSEEHNPAEAVRSIRRMKTLAAETGAAVWIGHDPDDRERWAAAC